LLTSKTPVWRSQLIVATIALAFAGLAVGAKGFKSVGGHIGRVIR
jgi:hypothetical protein